MKLPGFVGGAYTALSVDTDAQSCVNLYPETDESGAGKNGAALYLAPGLVDFATVGSGPIRGIWIGEGRCFVVSGSTLYEVNSGGTPTSLGSVGSDGRMVQMFPNGNQLVIISNKKVYCDNGSGPVQAQFEDAGGGVTGMQGAFLDSYFLAIDEPDSGDPGSERRFRHSLTLDGSLWNALDYASKEGYPDKLVGMLADHEDLWLMGSQTIEVWRNNYSAAPESFPWERDPGAFIHYGLIAEFSHTRLAGGIAWLSGDPRGHAVAFRAEGYRPKRVSTHAIEQEWKTYSTVTDAESFAYTMNGHEFWQINFPTANRTWVYDVTTNLWHRKGWWNGSSLDRHRARCHGYVFGKHLVGDHTSGKIYEMSSSLYSDSGTAIHWERTCPHSSQENARVFFSRMELEMERGTSATVTLNWSNDSGKSFNSGTTASNGASGEDQTRVFWNRLGSSRGRVFRFSGAATTKVALVDAYVQGEAGDS